MSFRLTLGLLLQLMKLGSLESLFYFRQTQLIVGQSLLDEADANIVYCSEVINVFTERVN